MFTIFTVLSSAYVITTVAQTWMSSQIAPANQHHTTDAGPPVSSGVLNVVATRKQPSVSASSRKYRLGMAHTGRTHSHDRESEREGRQTTQAGRRSALCPTVNMGRRVPTCRTLEAFLTCTTGMGKTSMISFLKITLGIRYCCCYDSLVTSAFARPATFLIWYPEPRV